MPLCFTTDDDDDLFEVTLSERLTQESYRAFSEELHGFLRSRPGVRGLQVLTGVPAFDARDALGRLDLKSSHLGRITHMALVSDDDWMCPLERALSGQFGTRVRMFPLKDLERARAWLATVDRPQAGPSPSEQCAPHIFSA